jgi:hypothetical protein
MTVPFNNMHYGVPVVPIAQVVGDLNGDQLMDCVVVDEEGDAIVVYRTAGEGTFDPPEIIPAGDRPFDADLADIDNDGDLDVIVVNRVSETIQLFANDGDGDLSSIELLPVGQRPIACDVIDIDRDGYLDLIVIHLDGSDLWYLRGNGQGTFALETVVPTLWRPASLVVADFNGDTFQDVAYTAPDVARFAVHIADGPGSWGPHSTITRYPPSLLRATDINRDGLPDMAGRTGSSTLVFYMSNGDGSFTIEELDLSGNRIEAFVFADMNGDSFSDLVAARSRWPFASSMAILYGVDHGRFGNSIDWAIPYFPGQLTAADANGDHLIDLLLSRNDPFPISDPHIGFSVSLNTHGLSDASPPATAARLRFKGREDDGVADFVQVLDDDLLHLNAITVELWFKYEWSRGHLIRKHHSDDAPASYNVFLDGARIHWRIWPDIEIIAENDAVCWQEWTHVACVSNGNQSRIYLDGVLAATGAGSDIEYTDAPLIVGKNIGELYEHAFVGELSELRIWDHARTGSEIRETMLSQLNGTEPGLVAYWPFDEGTGQVLPDRANGIEAILGNATFPGVEWGDPTWILVDCIADLNADGLLDMDDLIDFQLAHVFGDETADLDGSGTIDLADVVAFVSAYLNGCLEP